MSQAGALTTATCSVLKTWTAAMRSVTVIPPNRCYSSFARLFWTLVVIVVSHAASVFGAMGSVIGTKKQQHSITADAKAMIEAHIMQVVCTVYSTIAIYVTITTLHPFNGLFFSTTWVNMGKLCKTFNCRILYGHLFP